MKIIALLLVALVFLNRGTAQPALLKVIPEVQDFTASGGVYSIGRTASILVAERDPVKRDTLMKLADRLQQDLKELLNTHVLVHESELSKAPSGAVLLTYGMHNRKNDEAYEIMIDQGVTITGSARKGLFWATRTLLQLLENHKNKIPCGHITDYPDFPNRGFMLDVGRKFFTIDFLRHYVQLLSYYKMNEFQIHLNDNGFKKYYGGDWTKTYAAFRLESDTYPGLAAKDGHYTKKEFRDLQELGMQYGVNVIPEIDIPAHALAFTRYKPELAAADTVYARDHIDLSRPEVYTFFDQLFAEYIKGDNPCFAGPDVHIGTDEYVRENNIREVTQQQATQYRKFTDRYLRHITALGKKPRMWGGLRWLKDEPATPVYSKDVVMNAWSYDWVDPSLSLQEGFKLINSCDAWLYIVPAAGYYRDFLDEEWIYKNFRPEKMNPKETLSNFEPNVLGAMFAVWNDICGNGLSQQDVHFRAFPAVKVVGTKTWKVAPSAGYEKYAALARQTSEGPGLNYSGVYSKSQLQNIASAIGNKPVAFNGNTEIKLNGSDLGYNYSVSFDIDPRKDNAADAIIFQSAFSRLMLNTAGSGKIGFSRDGYVYTFNYRCKPGWQHIRITGNYKSVSLYVDDKLIETLEPYAKELVPGASPVNYQQTLFFPLEKAGDKNNGFKGKIKNLKLEIL